MKLDNTIISKLEDLSMLKLSVEVREEMASELKKILDMIDALRSVQIDVNRHEDTRIQRLRPDLLLESLPLNPVFQNCSSKKGEYFAAPKIIKKKNG